MKENRNQSSEGEHAWGAGLLPLTKMVTAAFSVHGADALMHTLRNGFLNIDIHSAPTTDLCMESGLILCLQGFCYTEQHKRQLPAPKKKKKRSETELHHCLTVLLLHQQTRRRHLPAERWRDTSNSVHTHMACNTLSVAPLLSSYLVINAQSKVFPLPSHSQTPAAQPRLLSLVHASGKKTPLKLTHIHTHIKTRRKS